MLLRRKFGAYVCEEQFVDSSYLKHLEIEKNTSTDMFGLIPQQLYFTSCWSC